MYRATERVLQRPVILKIFTGVCDGVDHRRFVRQATLLAELSHPHLVKVYRAGLLSTNVPFVAIESLSGTTLKEILARGTPPLAWTWECIDQILDALDEAHAHGVIHRDLSPDHVFLCDGKTDPFVKLLGFGLSANVKRPETRVTGDAAAVVGRRPDYVAPEQRLGRPADHRADVFSAGSLLFSMLTGESPSLGKDEMAAFGLLLAKGPPAPSAFEPTLIPDVDTLMLRATSVAPEDRYPSAIAFRKACRVVAQLQTYMSP